MKWFLVVLALTLCGACGGAGGDDDDTTVNPPVVDGGPITVPTPDASPTDANLSQDAT